MGSPDVQHLGMSSYVSVEERVPADHPVRKLRVLVNTILGELDWLLAERNADGDRGRLFDAQIANSSSSTLCCWRACAT